jgi:hypothetical protein
MGDLEKPGPLNSADRATTRKSDEGTPGQDPQRPADTIDTRDRSIDPAAAHPADPGTNLGSFRSARPAPCRPYEPAMNHFELTGRAPCEAPLAKIAAEVGRRSMSIPPLRSSGTTRSFATPSEPAEGPADRLRREGQFQRRGAEDPGATWAAGDNGLRAKFAAP